MAENQDGMEKSEQPTGKRINKAREDGKVAQSKELPPAVSMLVVTVFLYFYAPYLFTRMGRMLREYFMITNFEMTSQSTHELMMYAVKESAVMLAPLLGLMLLTGLIVNYYMVGILFTLKPILEPKFGQLNPFTGWGKFFNLKSLVELIKSVFKIFAISYLSYLIIKGKLTLIISMADMDIQDIIKILSRLLFEILWKVSFMVFIMAVLDYMYQKWQYNKDLMMTKHEVKEEMKQMEGDPKIKSKIKQIQRDMARKRMMDAVPQSDVVVTNPTHYAVALRYSPGQDRAPVVLAKGQRLIALRIRELAKEHGVLIHEDPPVARSLFKTVDIGDEIPENLYKAVAEILALVDKFKRSA